MAKDNGGSLEWTEDAECGKRVYRDKADIFFSYKSQDEALARKICSACPVRKECLKFALENKEIWGVWGGRNEEEIRRTLSVNADGAEVRKSRYPFCLYCSASTAYLEAKIVDKPGGGRWKTMRVVECTKCGFSWRSRTSANAVNAYFAERALREEKKSK
jgi:hypothetical protein